MSAPISMLAPILRTAKDKKPLLIALVALCFYIVTSAPAFTWANQGADGGDLLTAAVTNGVPHPPGYPLYTLLLQGWLKLFGWIFPQSNIAWRGNLFSAFCAALSVAVTMHTAQALLQQLGRARWSATLAGVGWMITPLLWSQATISEVYALHALFFSLLGWWTLASRRNVWGLLLLTMMGVAHHLTLLLLLPATFYLAWTEQPRRDWQNALRLLGAVALGGGLGLLFHLRTWWVAAANAPVNWGYVASWSDLWWVVSGQAYRGYLLSASAATTFDRISAWAYTLSTQFSPVGLAIALVGLGYFDQEKPRLRNFSLLWVVPVSIYAILYFTRDSEIYLLPVGWLLTIWLAVGLTILVEWLGKRFQQHEGRLQQLMLGLAVMGCILLVTFRWSLFSLRQENAAQEFLTQSSALIPPGSIVVSRGDEHTFALWYGVWASHELPDDLILVNDALYQFDWYRRLLAAYYPTVVGIEQSVEQLIEQNRGQRAIFFADQIELLPAEQLIPLGVLWQVKQNSE